MRIDVLPTVLKKVSRSFYLSLRLLPVRMREPAALAYLMARTSDTIADSPGVEVDTRIESLKEFAAQVRGETPCRSWSAQLVLDVEDPGERELLTMSHKLIERTRQLPPGQLELVLEVLKTIIDGQSFDLLCFGDGCADEPAVMPSADRLDEYTYQVAGSVGEFWTKLGHETLGEKFSAEPMENLLALGRNYGKGLQLVNILRDLPGDLAAGRCYLPVSDPADRNALLAEHKVQHARAFGLIGDGLSYASKLNGRRLRMASVLPAMLAEDTLELLDDADWRTLERGVKIPRCRVYSNLLQSLFY